MYTRKASLEDYDEFGNYIGLELGSVAVDEPNQDTVVATLNSVPSNDIRERHLMVTDDLAHHDYSAYYSTKSAHENVTLHASAHEIYGPVVETLVEEEDSQALEDPIVASINVREWNSNVEYGSPTRVNNRFLLDMLHFPEMVRNIAIVGHLHHGKTMLLDMLIGETHGLVWDANESVRYTDTHPLSRQRGISIKSCPISLVATMTTGKSLLMHCVDTPGHVDFIDEVASAMRLSDGIILVVDAVEGLMVNTEFALRSALEENVQFILVLNKIDRLMLELCLTPADAYQKLRHTVEAINTFISSINADPHLRLSPERGNVVFASTDMAWCFTLHSFSRMYTNFDSLSDTSSFADRLWGEIYFDPCHRSLTRRPLNSQSKPTFVVFVLEPLYKLYSEVLSEQKDTLRRSLQGLGIKLNSTVYNLDTRSLLRVVVNRFFGSANALIDVIATWIPSPVRNAKSKVEHTYFGPPTSELTVAMKACDSSMDTIVQVTKLYDSIDGQGFRALGRVLCGTVRKGMEVKVIGERPLREDDEEAIKASIENIWIAGPRDLTSVIAVPAGNLVLLSGIDPYMAKTATVAAVVDGEVHMFRPIRYMSQAVLKIAVEPVVPSELPKLLSGIRSVNKTYPLLSNKVEESGEHVMVGTGELYLDSVLHDLRKMYSEIEIKVSDPVTTFAETVLETSALKCLSHTPNKKNHITMIAEPLDQRIGVDIEAGRVTTSMTVKERGDYFEKACQWDTLASRSVWAFGPGDGGPNILLNDTLPSQQIDRTSLWAAKEHIVQGFQWGSKEGPLCDEPMRNVRFRMLDVSLATEAIFRGGGQLVPSVRRTCYSSFLMAVPRLMEPVYYVEIQAPADCVSVVYTVLARRRGHVTQDIPNPGSPLYVLKALIPVIDSNGFEADLRTATQGQAFSSQIFDHWSIVPGDPLDQITKPSPLQPASGQALARDLVLKTRRRKGLGDQVSVLRYLDEEFILALSSSGNEDLLW